MLEYFAWKKIKAHKEAAAAAAAASTTTGAEALAAGPQEVLSNSDEDFLRQQLETVDEPVVILSGEGDSGATTPGAHSLPPAPTPAPTPVDGRAATVIGEWSATGLKNRFGELRRTVSSATDKRKKGKAPVDVKGKGKEIETETLTVEKPATEGEEDELTAALDGLNLAAKNGRIFSMSAETKVVLDKFILILKDISNGVPTAYQDLTDLFDTSSKTFEDTYSSLPSFLQKIIKTLPKKIQAKIAPELLRTAAAFSPAAAAEAKALGDIVALKELVTKPGLLMGILKSVINFLKLKFPAALGGSMAMSVGVFVVMLVLWYCYKRGREVRLEAEAAAAAAELLDGVDDGGVEGSSSAPQAVVGEGTGKKKA